MKHPVVQIFILILLRDFFPNHTVFLLAFCGALFLSARSFQYIVGEQVCSTSQVIFRDAVPAVLAEDLILPHEFHGIDQRVAGCAADQTAPEFILVPHG